MLLQKLLGKWKDCLSSKTYSTELCLGQAILLLAWLALDVRNQRHHVMTVMRIQLVWRGACLWIKMLFVHLILALAIIISPLNGMIIHYFYRNHLIADVNSFCFLVNSVFQAWALEDLAEGIVVVAHRALEAIILSPYLCNALISCDPFSCNPTWTISLLMPAEEGNNDRKLQPIFPFCRSRA